MNEHIRNIIFKGPSLEEFFIFYEELSEKIKKEKEFLAKCTQRNVIDLWSKEPETKLESIKQLKNRIEILMKENEEIGKLLKEIFSLIDIDET